MEAKKSYWPLAVLVGTAILGATALFFRSGFWMHNFMGLTFILFAVLKLYQPAQFAEGFAMYDLVAKRTQLWGWIYPWVELALGLSYLAYFIPIATYIVTIVVMAVGTVGVLIAIKNKLDVRCVCMGTALNVPLSTVTLSEDIGMGVLALIMLITYV